MAKRGGMYNFKKRQKELARKKKQEAKRLKRQKDNSTDQGTEEKPAANEASGPVEDTPEISE